MRNTVLFCDGWEFSLQPIGTEYSDGFEWEPVDIPHDWLIEDAKDLYKTSTGWYRKRFTLPDDGRRTSLRFDGVYMDCRVYVNGKLAGEWKYGYTTFEFDITGLVCAGENTVTVRVDHREPNSRWYSGAGIYRKVWLSRFEETHFLPDGIYISAGTDGCVIVTSEAERPENESAAGLTVRTSIFRCGSDTALAECVSDVCAADRSALPPEVTRDGQSYSVNTQTLWADKPELWDIESPRLYVCRAELFRGDELIDSVSVRFGFRSIGFTPDHGFFLNGRHVKLHGACMHHDLGALGAAVNRSAIARQLSKLRGFGVNAIRTSHNPPAPELLELADELGFLILDEGFDMWERSKTAYDYGRFFPEWIRRDAASWIRRDRNHPCIIGWSIGNEIYDTHVSERGQEVTSLLKALVQSHDPRGNGYVTIGSNYMMGENARKCADILKVAGYNYSERLYDEQHAEHPDWCIYGSETSSVVQSRGIYHFPLDKPILCDDDEQCSSLGNSSPVWASKKWEANITADRDREFCAGQFIWTGFDYIGEPTPYSTKNSYFGQIDTAGFFKDSAYVYRSVWDSRGRPFVHIFPHWDFAEGDMIDVRVASNCPHVDLMLNGKIIGQKDFDPDHDAELTLDVRLPYEKGELRAVGYDADGNKIAEDCVRSFGDAARLVLSADRDEIPAGSEELCFIEIEAVDANGTFTANANNRVFVEVSGAGRLVGLDNGDSTDYEQYKGVSRRLFSGRLTAMIAPAAESGDITVRVSSPSLPDSVMTIKAAEAEPVKGISMNHRCTPRPCDCPDPENDIPVRRIELSGERRAFDREHRELSFEAKLYPANAVYGSGLEYRITTADGIDSHLAEIASREGNRVTVRCLGDGEFYLRAACRNGTEKIHVFSMLKLTSDGLGSALIDPYKMVAGGLYSRSGGNVTGGMQHGTAFGGSGGWIAFDSVDFGPVGSDRITIPLFANYNTPVSISVWDGIPGEGECLGEFEYALKPIWLTFQPMTYTLPKVLRGVHTISLSSKWCYDLQGFCFEKRRKETSELSALLAENIYGDSFTRADDAVTGIGNNVTFDFGMFSFDEPPKRIYITGRSALAVNSIHLQSEGSGIRRWEFKFEGCEGYTERAFPVDGMETESRISLVFLPGSDFDLRSIRFE